MARLRRYNVQLSPDFGDTWKERERRATTTASFNYGCDWQEGKCKEQREVPDRSTSRACCSTCASHVGFIRYLPWYAIRYVRSLFNQKTGFWREGRGCIVPRKWRSWGCLTYTCRHIDSGNPYGHAIKTLIQIHGLTRPIDF